MKNARHACIEQQLLIARRHDATNDDLHVINAGRARATSTAHEQVVGCQRRDDYHFSVFRIASLTTVATSCHGGV